MTRGHVTGARRHRPSDATWYASIEAAALAELDRTWPLDVGTRQAVPTDLTQERAHTIQGPMHHTPTPEKC